MRKTSQAARPLLCLQGYRFRDTYMIAEGHNYRCREKKVFSILSEAGVRRADGGWRGTFKEGDRQRETKQGEGKESMMGRFRETISASTAQYNHDWH